MGTQNRVFSSSRQPGHEPVPQELAELGRLINDLPADTQCILDAAFQRAVDATSRRRLTLELVQEALSQLRLDIKYLMFDLEVTRRERDQLRQAMED